MLGSVGMLPTVSGAAGYLIWNVQCVLPSGGVVSAVW